MNSETSFLRPRKRRVMGEMLILVCDLFPPYETNCVHFPLYSFAQTKINSSNYLSHKWEEVYYLKLMQHVLQPEAHLSTKTASQMLLLYMINLVSKL